MLFLATSCLQGRPLDRACAELAALDVGLQLAPGNHPTPGHAPTVPTRTHHGFSFTLRRVDVWDAAGRCLVGADSVHPPRVLADPVEAWLERGGFPVLETMYAGHVLGTGAELDAAMDRGVSLAVDVSHVFLQRAAGTITEATWRRLADYDRVAEVHVSANDGRSDAHRPLAEDTFGLGWARARLRAGTPTVLECYMHRLDERARRRQIALVRGGDA